MTTLCSVFIATSLDGFIARKNGDLDWLPQPSGNEDFGYNSFIASVDTLVMGRKTYEKALTFKEWPYRSQKVVVLSSSFPESAIRLSSGVEGTSASPNKLVERLTSAGSKHVYVDGGKTIRSFLDAGLIHEMTITIVPVLLGEGLPLFGTLTHDTKLGLISARSYDNSLVQIKYRVMQA